MQKLICLAIGITCWSIASAQPYFTVEELYNKSKIVIDSQTAIVDINSDLNINLDPNQITAYLARKFDTAGGSSGKLETLKKLLVNEIRILRLMQAQIVPKATHKERLQILGESSDLMSNLLTILTNDPALRADANKIVDEYFTLQSSGVLDKNLYPTVESYLVIQLSLLNKQMLADLKKGKLSQVQVMLKAYLTGKDGQKRKVHIENFDNYADGEFYEVPRWVTSFSEADIAEFKTASTLATTANGLINSNTAEIKNMLALKLSSVECIKALLVDVRDIKENRDSIFSVEIAAAGNYIDQMESEVSKLQKDIENLKNLDNGSGANVLELYNALMENFTTIAARFKSSTDLFATQLPAALTANPRLVALKTSVASCSIKIKEDVELVTKLTDIIKGVLKPFSTTTASVNAAVGETFAHSLSDLPDLGKITLKTTGKRQGGDKLEIAISYKVKDDASITNEGIVFDFKNLTLEQVNFYSVASISVVLANPYNESAAVNIKNKFQFAPAGSLLVKFGSRTCPLWNTISPGIGVILATPDLDMDGSPDFSLGGAVTVFRDVVNFGLSYDTKTDSPFWHIGLSLPFTVFGGAVNMAPAR